MRQAIPVVDGAALEAPRSLLAASSAPPSPPHSFLAGETDRLSRFPPLTHVPSAEASDVFQRIRTDAPLEDDEEETAADAAADDAGDDAGEGEPGEDDSAPGTDDRTETRGQGSGSATVEAAGDMCG